MRVIMLFFLMKYLNNKRNMYIYFEEFLYFLGNLFELH